MNSIEEIRRGLRRLTMATVVLYIALIGAGIYVYSFSRQAKQIDQNTQRLNGAIGAACEVGIAPDTKEPKVIHDLATEQLVIHSRDCEIIVRRLEDNEP